MRHTFWTYLESLVLDVETGDMGCTPMVAEWLDVSSLVAPVVFFWNRYVIRVMVGMMGLLSWYSSSVSVGTRDLVSEMASVEMLEPIRVKWRIFFSRLLRYPARLRVGSD